ncbi:MAG: hypothetical protein KKH98_02475 [Spirochaetes bacterium]|nr:hypothetical protein [Spirochaetota bacterium]
MRITLKVLFIIIFLSASALQAATGHGGVPGIQQRLNLDARFMSLGSAYDAVSYDSDGIYYNPAGLVTLANPIVTLSYLPVWDNLTHIFFAGIGFDTKYLPIGIGFINMSTKGIKQRTDSPEVEGLMEYRDFTLYAATGVEVLPHFSLGARSGFYYQKIYTYEGWGIGADLSFLWRVKDPYKYTKNKLMRILQPISFGIILYNVLPPQITLSTGSISFPLLVKGSLTYRYPTLWKILNIETGFGVESIPDGNSTIVNSGIELTMWKFFFLRGGYKITDKTFTIGSGVTMRDITFDYGLSLLSAGINYYTINVKVEF